MKRYIFLLIFFIAATGCHAGEPAVEWPIGEVIEERSSERDCPPLRSDAADPDEVPFILYEYLACRADDGENLVFSPAAIYIALADLTDDLDGADAQAIAEMLGHDSPQQLVQQAQDFREELLERRPRGASSSPSVFQDYEIAEEDPERLWEALGVEFFSIQCASSRPCHWHPQNGRWSESFLDDAQLPPEEAGDITRIQGFVLRGQWYRQGVEGDREFHVDKDKSVEVTTFSTIPHQLGGDTDVTLIQRQTLGEEFAYIVIKSTTHTLPQIEEMLSSSTVGDWIDSLEHNHRRTGAGVAFPAFDIEETVDLEEPFALPTPLQNTTRLALTLEGMNYPDTVELKYPDDLAHPFDGTTRDPPLDLNQPFVFLVYDHTSESIVVMGRIVDPTAD